MKRTWPYLSSLALGLLLLVTAGVAPIAASALGSSQNPQSGSVGMQGTVPSAPPSRGATITTPVNGQSFTKTPITVGGLCPSGLLVKIFSNNVFVGAVMCTNGSYSVQIDLFDGQNDLIARVYDALDQPGPDSNVVHVTFINAQFQNTGIPLLSVTSNYARRGANPGQTLTWPFIISGGTAPYAVSIDWGDGKPASLLSEAFAGNFTADHVYDNAGLYQITVRATDKNGQTAYLQVVGEANGAVTQSRANASNGPAVIIKNHILWLPAALLVPLLAVAFWLGRRYELSVLRKHLEQEEV